MTKFLETENPPSAEQIEAALNESEACDRHEAFLDYDHFLSPEQIENGLMDHHPWVREGAARTAMTLSAYQIERGLTDPDSRVRRRFSKRKDFEPTPHQIDRALNDGDWFVRYIFAMNENFIPNSSQLSKIKLDQSSVVRDVYEKRKMEWQLKQEQQTLHQQFLSQPTTKTKKTL